MLAVGLNVLFVQFSVLLYAKYLAFPQFRLDLQSFSTRISNQRACCDGGLGRRGKRSDPRGAAPLKLETLRPSTQNGGLINTLPLYTYMTRRRRRQSFFRRPRFCSRYCAKKGRDGGTRIELGECPRPPIQGVAAVQRKV